MARKGKARNKDKTVVVRYPAGERNFMIIFFVLCFLVAIAFGLWSGEIVFFFLFLVLIILPAGLMMAYHLSWKIVITAAEISRHSCFQRPRVYRYSEMVKAVETFYASERDTVLLMQFHDGKWITIRGRDENYTRAVNKVLKQRKILVRDDADETFIPKGTELYIPGTGNGSLNDKDFWIHGVRVQDD